MRVAPARKGPVIERHRVTPLRNSLPSSASQGRFAERWEAAPATCKTITTGIRKRRPAIFPEEGDEILVTALRGCVAEGEAAGRTDRVKAA